MKRLFTMLTMCLMVAALGFAIQGCGSEDSGTVAPPADKEPATTPAPAPAEAASEAKPAGPVPSFSLAWSEYPSWSTFGVADEVGLIDKDKGKLGTIEEKWQVDIVLKEAEYDPCLVMYGAAQVDAVCITNMDILNPSLSVPSVAILPTSTSFGADACIVGPDITEVAQLKGKKVHGLAQTVSEYCFVRNLEIMGENPADYTFSNMDPGQAAIAMQQKQEEVQAIVVWNPFVLETLNRRPDTRVIFDSTTIPGEIIDMVVATQAALDKPGGKAFACAVIDAFYAINQRMAAEDTRDDTLIALGEKFSNLDLQSMRKVVQQTKFYATPAEGLGLYEGEELKGTMEKVVGFCTKAGIVEKEPSVGYGAKGTAAGLRFDPSYIKQATAKSGS
jgi:NitT/TauT family transport system substrate-binding protein